MLLRASRTLRFSVRLNSTVSTVPTGTEVHDFVLRNEPNFRLYFERNGKRISPWHDVELKNPDGTYNFVNEIPKNAVEKFEVATDEKFNPIKQDLKKKKLRLYPFASLVNYGCLPQTWEDPKFKDPNTGFLGDNDPVDVCDLSETVMQSGSVYPVKVLGVLGMIDEGEMDWKVLAINASDPLANELDSPACVEKKMPGKIRKIIDWFRTYKVPDGKPINEFAFDEECKDAAFAEKVIESTHAHWASRERLIEEGLK